MMTEFEFIFRIDGLSADDNDAIKSFYDKYDGLLFWRRENGFLSIYFLGDNREDALKNLNDSLKIDFPRVQFLECSADT